MDALTALTVDRVFGTYNPGCGLRRLHYSPKQSAEIEARYEAAKLALISSLSASGRS